MKIYSEIKGNIHAPEWAERVKESSVEHIDLDQWTAQKSRFVAATDSGREYAVSLQRHTRLLDGDIIDYDAAAHRIAAVRITLNDIMVADLSALASEPAEKLVRTALELGHAIGNQHWPAVVKGFCAYIPLTVDRKVMRSVMQTHHLEGVTCEFRRGSEIIPYLAPHEIRRLFGGAGHEPHAHSHGHDDAHTHQTQAEGR